MKLVAILLTVHNRKVKTLQCLNRLFEQMQIDNFLFDVYLTNDGCTDGTYEAVTTQFPSVKIITGDGSLFWNRGMYLAWTTAVKKVNYDFFIWLNDDTLLLDNAIVTLFQTSDSFQNKAIVVGTTAFKDTNLKITYGGRDRTGNLIAPDSKPIICDHFNGNIVMFPEYVFEKVGYNDPLFQHALGDFDYGLRAKKLGIKSIIAPYILGICEEHEHLPTWCNPQKDFKKRWAAFRTPLGHNPEEYFIYERRHNGLLMACYHYFTNHMRVFFPSIWNFK